MKALIQRVSRASVTVDGQCKAAIEDGMLALVGIEREDGGSTAAQMLDKLLTYRIFGDQAGRMNLDLLSCGGSLLLVSQFTLVADTSKGRRPGFSSAASPERAESVFRYLVETAQQRLPGRLGSGVFGAHMEIELVNDGPVTFMLDI